MTDLSEIELFRSLPPDALARLASHANPRTFSAGDALMRQGEVGDRMHVIAKGRVRVERTDPRLPDPLVLAELGPGEVVGEMGVLDQAPRSASVTAVDETETVELSAAVLSVVMLQYPQSARALLGILSRRLRDANDLAEEMLRRAQRPPS